MLFGMQYQAFMASSRNEMHSMERNVNSRFLSRIGLVAEEIKNLQYQILIDIENRAVEINDNEAECILEARSTLESSLTEAGAVINSAAVELNQDLQILNEIAVYGMLEQIELLMSRFEFEILVLFGNANPVTSMFTLMINLESEIRNYGALFEYYVNEIYVEMIIYDMLIGEVSETIIPRLDGGLEEFRNSGQTIRSSLATCNWMNNGCNKNFSFETICFLI